MKRIMIVLLAVLIGCTAPPEDVPRAEIAEPAMDEMADEDGAMADEAHDAMGDGEADGEMVDTAAEEVSLDLEKSSFNFIGYGPGKVHPGTFEELDGVLLVNDDEVVGVKGAIQAASVDTGIEGLNNHLRNPDFFDVEKYPEITFESTAIEDGTMKGVLFFHGVEKEISFPVNVSEDGVTADFVLDTEPYNIRYVGMNPDVRISFVASR